MITSFSKDASHISAQETATERLKEKYGKDRKVELDCLSEPVIWARDTADAITLTSSFMLDEQIRINFLSDVTAYDNCDEEDGAARFVLVYQLYSTDLKVRVRIKALIAEGTEARTLNDVFPAANWLEREIFDLYGIRFQGHPNLRRIMMDERFEGYPLRKDYAMKKRQPFGDNIPLHLGGHPLHVDTHLEEGEN